MSIQRWYTTQFTLKRQVFSNDSSALVAQDSFDGQIQQETDERFTQQLGLRFTKAFSIWCPLATDVQEGDRIESGGVTYDVRFVEDRTIGKNSHKHLLVEKSDE